LAEADGAEQVDALLTSCFDVILTTATLICSWVGRLDGPSRLNVEMEDDSPLDVLRVCVT